MRGPTDEAKKPAPVDSSDVDIVVPAPPFTTSSTASSIAELPLGVPDSGRGSGAHSGVDSAAGAGKPSVGSASEDDSARASAVTPGPASVLDMRDMTIMNDTDLLDVDDDDEEDDDDRVSLLTDDEDMAHDDLDGVDGLGSGGSSSSGRARSHHSEVEEIPAGALTFQVSRASVTRTGVIPCCVFVGRVTWGAVEWEIHFGQKQLLRLHLSVMADLLYHRRAWLPSRGVRLPWTLFREKRAERRIADVPIVQDYVQSLLRHDDIRNSEPLLSFLEVSPSRAMSRYGPSLKEGYVHMRMNGAFQLPLYSCFNRTIEALYRHLYRTWMRIAFIAAVVTFIFPICLVLVTALPAFVTGKNIAIDDAGSSVDEKITVARVIFGLFMVFVMVYSALFVYKFFDHRLGVIPISEAKYEIMIAGWWVTPDLYLLRPGRKLPINTDNHGDGSNEDEKKAVQNETQLRNLLLLKAQEGVKIYVLIYREVKLALTLNTLEKYTDRPDDYVSFFGLRKYGMMPNGFVSTEQIYIHSKLLIADDKIAILGSANINDRSMMGDRDSEIALVIEDVQFEDGMMNDQPYQRGVAVGSLRRQLFREHLGLAEDDTMTLDPGSDWSWRKIRTISKRNTEIFESVFDCAPSNSMRSFSSFNNMNVMQIFENQRMNVLKGRPGHVWSNDNLRDGDYAPWTDVNGVPINMDKIDLKDFVLDRFKDKKRKHFFSMDHDGWCYARNFSVFQEVRMHNFRKRDKLQHFVTDRLMAQEDETRARGQLSEIRGHLVEFPVHFLAEEILKPSIMPRDIHI
ncbi:hypothetical protein ATCC90586_002949 [Pythium insidiosum]|nr:hypothetical protein ATCC90586_002949 [Pythium insidiosum]